MEIFYSGYSSNFDGPADRRRFLYYAKERKIPFNFYSKSTKSGLVISNPFSSNLKRVVSLAKRKKIFLVFEAIDSLFLETIFCKYHILKSIKELRFNYKLINDAFRYSSSIVVSNNIQREYLISQGFGNIHVIPDYSFEYKKTINLKSLKYKKKLNLGWEGMGINIKAIKEIVPYAIHKNNNLIVITDKNALRYLSNYVKSFTFYEWDKLKHIENIQSADVMLIPVLSNSWIHMAKPATRIRHYFNMEKPVLAYPSSANKLEMEKAGVGEFCAPIDLWPKLINLLKNPEIRKDYISRIVEYKRIFLSDKYIDSKWKVLLYEYSRKF